MRGCFRFPLWETDHKKGRRHGDGKGNAATLPGGNTAVEGSYRGRQEPEKKMETEKKIKRQVAVRKNCKKVEIVQFLHDIIQEIHGNISYY